MKLNELVSFIQSLRKNYTIPTSSYCKLRFFDSPQYHHPQLQILKQAGASSEHLKKCQSGFDLFEEAKKFGWKDYTKQLTNGCLKIIETRKAQPQHLSVFFGTIAYLLRHNRIGIDDINRLAKDHADLIRNNFTPKEVQDITWQEYVLDGSKV